MDLLEKKLLMEWRLEINKSKSCMQTTNRNYFKAVSAQLPWIHLVSSDDMVLYFKFWLKCDKKKTKQMEYKWVPAINPTLRPLGQGR